MGRRSIWFGMVPALVAVAAGCGGSGHTTSIANATRHLDGDPLPAELLGEYYDGGESSVGWYFLPAGDDFCVQTARTDQSCLKITRPGGSVVDYGPMVVSGDRLIVYLIYDEDNQGVFQVIVVPYTVTKDGVDLHRGLIGAPRAPLVRGHPKG
jgi:hypothetical protein